MYLTLERIKKHLNIDSDFTGDDEYLLFLEDVAEKTVQRHIDDNLEVIANGGELPSPLLQAMLLYIGNLYMSRESIKFSNVQDVPFSYDYLLSLYKNYNNTKHNS